MIPLCVQSLLQEIFDKRLESHATMTPGANRRNFQVSGAGTAETLGSKSVFQLSYCISANVQPFPETRVLQSSKDGQNTSTCHNQLCLDRLYSQAVRFLFDRAPETPLVSPICNCFIRLWPTVIVQQWHAILERTRQRNIHAPGQPRHASLYLIPVCKYAQHLVTRQYPA